MGQILHEISDMLADKLEEGAIFYMCKNIHVVDTRNYVSVTLFHLNAVLATTQPSH